MIVFLGGAGAGLSALVNIFYELGFENIVVVDKYKSEISEKLESKGIKVVIGDDVYNFSSDDIIIYSDAVVNSKDFEKVKNNVKFSYFEFVGEVSKRFQTISIAGTHGKTSTTSVLISSLVKSNFEKLGLGIVGGFVPDLNNQNYFVNTSKKQEIKEIFEKLLTAKGKRPSGYFKELFFVIEADEFNRHFLLLDTYIAGITKVDHDHKDIYPTEQDYFKAFEIFINKTRKEVFTNDKEFLEKIKNFNLHNKINFVDIDKNIQFDYIFGEHMKKNAALVAKIMQNLEIDNKIIYNSIKSFKGVWRRQEYLGDLKDIKKLKVENGKPEDLKNIKIYTDYAHHPVEIEATYKSFRENFPNKKIIGVFQAHQIFRFVSYEEDFIKTLKKFDKIYLYDIYSVREEKLLKKLTGLDLPIEEQKKIIGNNIAKKIDGEYIENFDNLIKKLQKENGVVVCMSAGDLDYKLRKLFK